MGGGGGVGSTTMPGGSPGGGSFGGIGLVGGGCLAGGVSCGGGCAIAGGSIREVLLLEADVGGCVSATGIALAVWSVVSVAVVIGCGGSSVPFRCWMCV